MATMCGKRLKYLRSGFTMLEMAYEVDPHSNPNP